LDELAEMIAAAPPMRGGEYLRTETLAGLWQPLDADMRRDIAAGPGGLGEWLQRRIPTWHRVGRVCFHLAENKRDAECPFAFLATYAPKLLDGRLRAVPAAWPRPGRKLAHVWLHLIPRHWFEHVHEDPVGSHASRSADAARSRQRIGADRAPEARNRLRNKKLPSRIRPVCGSDPRRLSFSC
jgi:hypothetical protein